MKAGVVGALCIGLLAASAGASTPSYDEPHRPQLHFTPPSMWMNDPNGLVYYDGAVGLRSRRVPQFG